MVDIVREQDQSIYTHETYWFYSIYLRGKLLFSTEELQYLLKSPGTLSASGATVVLDADSNAVVKDMAELFFIERDEDKIVFWEANQPHDASARDRVGECSVVEWAYAVQQLVAHIEGRFD